MIKTTYTNAYYYNNLYIYMYHTQQHQHITQQPQQQPTHTHKTTIHNYTQYTKHYYYATHINKQSQLL